MSLNHGHLICQIFGRLGSNATILRGGNPGKLDNPVIFHHGDKPNPTIVMQNFPNILIFDNIFNNLIPIEF